MTKTVWYLKIFCMSVVHFTSLFSQFFDKIDFMKPLLGDSLFFGVMNYKDDLTLSQTGLSFYVSEVQVF